MTPFAPLIAGASALAALVVLLLTLPWWKPALTRRIRRNAGDTRSASAGMSETAQVRHLNAAIYRDQLAELERDRASGQLADTDFQLARDEIKLRLLDDMDAAAEPVGATPSATPASVPRRRRAPTWLAVLLLVPLSAASLYLQLGTPAAALDTTTQARKTMLDMTQAVASLAAKLAANPDNPQGWAMLARSYGMLGRWPESVAAFEKIGPLLDTDPDMLAAFAEVRFRASGETFTGEVRALIDKALALAPANPHALMLRGSDAYQSARWPEAVAAWQALYAQLEPGSDDAREVGEVLARARAELAKTGAHIPSATRETFGGTAPLAANTAQAISGQVDLSPEWRAQVKPDATVFVFARALSDGDTPAPRMPLAALRIRVADLPYAFVLDDSMAMSPNMKISAFPRVRIEARVSASGNAIAASGDLAGESAAVKPGATQVQVHISRKIP